MHKEITKQPWLFRVISILIPVLIMHLAATQAQANVTISWNDVKQRVDGFGVYPDLYQFGGDQLSSSDQQSMYDLLFSPTIGIGLSIVRFQIYPQIEPSEGTWDFKVEFNGIARVSMPDEAVILNKAKSYGVNIFWGAPWTPPA
jgi:glucuronoarabinoxylan endo-1,4-beta-xylanase